MFDVFGRRIVVINDADGAGPQAAVRENIVYDGENVWADFSELGEAIARYLFGDTVDSNIARWSAGEGTAWYLTDHLRTVRAITDAAGLLINQTTFDSFGRVLAETNAEFGDRFKFTGRELNSGNDYFYRARTYNASQGRFTSLDPIGFIAGESNLLAYVFNSPGMFTDPGGLNGEGATTFSRGGGAAIGFAFGVAGFLGCLVGIVAADAVFEQNNQVNGTGLLFGFIAIKLFATGAGAIAPPAATAFGAFGPPAIAFAGGLTLCFARRIGDNFDPNNMRDTFDETTR